jgi:hypothetical protein
MNFIKKFLIITLIFFVFLIVSFLLISYNVKNNTDAYFKYKKYIPHNLKKEIRTFFTRVNTIYIYKTSKFKFKQVKDIEVSSLKNKKMQVFSNPNLIWTGPRAYFASNDEHLFLITGTGILMHTPIASINNNVKIINFKKIQNNFEKIFINYKEKTGYYSFTSMIKSIIYKDKSLYVSAVQKINDKCFTHIIYKGLLSLNNIEFKEFYKFDKCKPFYTDYLGGTIANFNSDKFLFTVGDWTVCEDYRWVDANPKGFCTKNGAQSLKSDLGKIFELNLQTKELKIVSIGHDNPQGIIYDKKNNIIFSTEHGPQGGDEININVNPTKGLKNFGYPISSYGEHYGYPSPDVEYLYIEAPLHKSHKKYGFIEPMDYFVPSIGISDIEKYKNKLLVASMGSEIEQGDLSLYIYDLDQNQNIKKKELNKIYQRIRDIHFVNDYAVLFLESTGSIGIFQLKNLD